MQNHSNRNQNNIKIDTSETLQNKGNLSAGQKDTLSQFFLKSVLSLFQNTAGPEHEENIHQLKQTAQRKILGGTATASLQNMQNVPFLHTIRTLSVAEQNAIFMQNEDEFGTEESKGFKLKKALIYTGKSIYELES